VGIHTTRERHAAAPHDRQAEARDAVTSLYQVHAVGLFRYWYRLRDPGKAVPYLRSSVLNGCRSALRRRRKLGSAGAAEHTAESAEQLALLGEEHRQVLAALRQLPARQREALVLRFYGELGEPEIAAAMGISQGTVKSTTSRALAALGRLVKEAG